MNNDLNIALQEAYQKLSKEQQILVELKITDLAICLKYDLLKTEKEKQHIHLYLDVFKKKIDKCQDEKMKATMLHYYKTNIQLFCSKQILNKQAAPIAQRSTDIP